MKKCGETVSGGDKRQTNSWHKVVTEGSDTVTCIPSHRVCKSLCYVLLSLTFLTACLYKALIALYISPLDSSNDGAAYQIDRTESELNLLSSYYKVS